MLSKASSSSALLCSGIRNLSFDLISPCLSPLNDPVMAQTAPQKDQCRLFTLPRVWGQAGCWGSPHPAGLCCLWPSCPSVERCLSIQGGVPEAHGCPHMFPGVTLNQLPVRITLPFLIGAILIGPFLGTNMKEKALCSVGFGLRH